MKINWDVIVVGGGPAGLFAAWEIAKTGKSVLLCERKREMGVPVRCAEACAEEDINKYLPVEERWVAARTDSFIIVLPNGKEIKLSNEKYSGFILNRDLFEYDMAAKASELGTKIMMKANVIDLIHNDDGSAKGVKVDENGTINEYYASVVIAADGVESRIARKMGIDTTLKAKDIEPCVQVTASNVNLKENALYIYIGTNYAPGGYAWAFPKGNNCANIGLGINGKYASTEKYSKEYLDEFLATYYPHVSVQKYITGGVPVSLTLKTLCKENMLIAGDAGRMVNPLNGGGICHAIDSGVLAGKAAIEACDDPLKIKKKFKKYEKEIYKTIGKTHESQYRIKDIVYQMDDEDYNNIGDEILKISEDKRSFFRIFSQMVKHKPEFLIDVVKAFTGI
ncbi:MAG: NAD(P)/FAD-dependent oxidoreductase [Candidatus Marinimicrobia bacterium]|nr:NAD(P)/FAD-dependent oxidoreductase [Candidatus Neomarinimicrobiota bacterium]